MIFLRELTWIKDITHRLLKKCFHDTTSFYSLGCGGFVNETSGVLYKTNGGDEAEERCIWKIGKAGVSDAVAIFTLETIYLRYCTHICKNQKQSCRVKQKLTNNIYNLN